MSTLEELRVLQKGYFPPVWSSQSDSPASGVASGDPPQTLTQSIDVLLVIEIESQLLRVFEEGEEVHRYPVSTSLRGAGCRNGTGCTPLGWHRIDEKIGREAPRGTIFKGRIAGSIADDLSLHKGDLITSRILWLQGLLPGYNRGGDVDSRSRYIYIHGTGQEHLIGTPVSMGCVRMLNDDVIALFDFVETGMAVFISQHTLS